MVFRSSISWDEMQADIQSNLREANRRATPEQKSIGRGDYWVNYDRDSELWIFGYIKTEEEVRAGEIECGASNAEAQEVVEADRANYDQGFRYGMAFSLALTRDELGQTHVASMAARLTKEQFEEARSAEWYFENLLAQDLPWAITLYTKVIGPLPDTEHTL